MLIRSASSIANVGFLIVLFMFVFSVLGTGFFFNAQLRTNLNKHANFQTFGNSFMTLFRCITGEGWNLIMSDLKQQLCLDQSLSLDYACGGDYVARIYFFAFFVIGSLIMLNLFVAVMLNNISGPDPRKSWRHHMTDKFKSAWRRIDVDGTMHIHISELERLLLMIGAPLGASIWSSHSDRLPKLLALQIPVIAGEISYIDTFIALSRYCLVTTDIQDGFFDPFADLPPSHITATLIRRVWRFKFKHRLRKTLKHTMGLFRRASRDASRPTATAALQHASDMAGTLARTVSNELLGQDALSDELEHGPFREFQEESFIQFRYAYSGWLILRLMMRARTARRKLLAAPPET
jgi:hypothetical protein